MLWDVAERTELDWCLQRSVQHFDPALPVVDIGCGNGRFTRLLAGEFRMVVGVEISTRSTGCGTRVGGGAGPASGG